MSNTRAIIEKFIDDHGHYVAWMNNSDIIAALTDTVDSRGPSATIAWAVSAGLARFGQSHRLVDLSSLVEALEVDWATVHPVGTPAYDETVDYASAEFKAQAAAKIRAHLTSDDWHQSNITELLVSAGLEEPAPAGPAELSLDQRVGLLEAEVAHLRGSIATLRLAV